MQEVAILGAGELGGALAHLLARRDLAATVRLLDASGQVAAGKALDIMQSAPIQHFACRVAGSSDLSRAAGASVIVLADRSGGGEWESDEGLLLLKQMSQIVAAGSVIVCAGAGQRELVDRGVRELRFDPARLVGSAPEALSGALRALIALEVNGAARDIALTVLGIPPDRMVVPWEDVTIAGFAATRTIDEPTRRRIAARVAPLWPPGPHALAAAAGEAVACLAAQSRRILSCFVAPQNQSGRGTRTAALPVRLGPGGIGKVELPTLSAQARVALDNAMLL